jgi:hypothetical protein
MDNTTGESPLDQDHYRLDYDRAGANRSQVLRSEIPGYRIVLADEFS